MSAVIDDIIPTALDCRKKSAEQEAEKAADYLRRNAIIEGEKKAKEAAELGKALVRRAVVDDEQLVTWLQLRQH